MNSKELRLGNYLQGEDGQIHVVESLNSYGGEEINEDGPDVYYEPIPLTSEWLAKLGFEKRHKPLRKEDCDDWFVLLPGPTSLEVRVFPDGSLIVSVELEVGTGFIKLIHCPRYVHQMQNVAHSLTGEELIANDIYY